MQIRNAGLETPVVIVSAFDDATNVVQAMRFGAIDLLPKSTTPHALRQVATDILKRRIR